MQPTGTATAVARADATDPAASGSARRTGDTPENPLARLAPRGPVEVLDAGFELFRFRIGRLITLAAVLFGPIWLLDLGLLAAFGAPEVDRTAIGPAALLLGTGAEWSWVIVLLNGLALSTLGLCVGALVMAWADGDDLSLRRVLGLAARRSWVVALLTPMCWAIKAPLAFCLPLVGYLIGDALVFVASTVAGAERSGPLRSIGRSFALTKRNYGRALLIVAGSLLISQVLRSSFTLGPSAIAALLGASDTLIVTLQRVSSAIVVVVEPLTACIAASAYLDLRCRSEAFDLVRRRKDRVAAMGRGTVRIQEPVDPSQVGDDVAEIMSRPEFRYEPSWFERFTDWVAERLESLFGQAAPGSSASFGGGAPPFVAWLLILVVVALVGLAVYYAVRNRVPRTATEADPTEVEIEHRRDAQQWRTDAEAHEAAGEWKLAIRARYRELVRTLTDRGQLPDVAGLTTGELRTALESTTPDAAAPFGRCSELFEGPWYADDPTGAAENAEFRRLADGVRSASKVDSPDAEELTPA